MEEQLFFSLFQFRVYNGVRGSELAQYERVGGSPGALEKSLGNQLNRHAGKFLPCEKTQRSKIIRKEDRNRVRGIEC